MHPAVEQCRWINKQYQYLITAGRASDMAAMPDDEWNRYIKLWNRAEHSGRDGSGPQYPNAKQQAFLDRVEAGMKRIVAGKGYAVEATESQAVLFE